ncbi:alpha/beta fold hydrolase [Flavobacterium hercynium]|uniref:Alpha/beta hydrolase n=1 Tax=Flavobacterium hercynium TaxID=387094 RepID=A0A226HRG9_9FLAO|nr:alpha/beta fold hydrolase [Flavobacterium hercynium]OXA96221.1 alpha/beta hydrolase [Flavobacterium hercynium]SMP05096.1 Pimeloyl-ACP methyl ester carboxylesterase [Flavobacterium hercynium]
MLYSKIEGEGKPFIIMHGFLGMSDNWKTLASQYVDAGFQVHILDLRNHGRSFHSDEFTYEAMAQDVFEYCQENKLNKIDILGHSMGGKVAMLFATTHPEMVDRLIVADIGPKFYKQHHQDILAGLNAVDFSIKPSRNDVEATLTEYVPDFGTRQFLMKNLYWQEPGQLAFRFNLEVFNNNLDEIGKPLPDNLTFDKPTLFVRGGNSGYVLDTDIDQIKTHFPDLRVETIPNAGHWLHAENPKMFFELTTTFLKE